MSRTVCGFYSYRKRDTTLQEWNKGKNRTQWVRTCRFHVLRERGTIATFTGITPEDEAKASTLARLLNSVTPNEAKAMVNNAVRTTYERMPSAMATLFSKVAPYVAKDMFEAIHRAYGEDGGKFR